MVQIRRKYRCNNYMYENCLEHSLECSAASGYESTLECTCKDTG